MSRYDEWRIYAKDGKTLRAAFRAVLKDAPYEGVVSRSFVWVLEDRVDFEKLIDVCRFAEPSYSSRTPQRASFVYRDKSPGETNTVRIMDPRNIETGYYILIDCAPLRDITLGGALEFGVTAHWLGPTLPPEPIPGLYRTFLGLLPGDDLYPDGTLLPGSG